jgi:Zn-dependent protease
LGFDLHGFLISLFVLVVSLSVHEWAHAKAAYLAGDDTAKLKGRLSLNPLDHLDPVGTVMMIVSSLMGFGIGWAKPVPVNPMRFRHPRWDSLKVSLWGPLSNLLFALVLGQVLRFFVPKLGPNDLKMLALFVRINIGLALFNLLPISPLDGSHILSALLPYEAARKYDYFMARHGFSIIIAAVLVIPAIFGVSIFGLVLQGPANLLYHQFSGLTFGQTLILIQLKGG